MEAGANPAFSICSNNSIWVCAISISRCFANRSAPSAIATSPLGYVRLHGRNYDSWWRENKYYGERYDYLYSVAELDPWIDRIKTVEHSAKDTYVVTNNHYIGKAVVNAFEISSILKDEALPCRPNWWNVIQNLSRLQEREKCGQNGCY